MSNRLYRINSLIKKELGSLMQTTLERPKDFLVTIISVTTSADLRYAKISISVIPEGKTGSALKYMRHNLKKLQKQLHQKLFMRPLPRLTIALDQGEKHAARIEKIIAQDKNND